NGPMEQLSLSDMDLATGHTFVHYFHTGMYETIHTESDPTILTAVAKLKQAVAVYLATVHHDIPCLKELAISEMRTHASRLDLMEFILAIGEGFQRLGPESWVHGYLEQKAKAAFRENHTVFTSEAFLDTLDNTKVARFMMRCMAECYDNKISNMGLTEKGMSEILSDCQPSLPVLSQKEAVAEQNTTAQHQIITPLADESAILECYAIETLQDDLVSVEDFCTISCPSSEWAGEPRACLEELVKCSAELREHYQNVPSHGPIAGSITKRCDEKPNGCHHLLKNQALKDSVVNQSTMNEQKETKKQRKMRLKQERKEMKELWEIMKQIRSEAAKGSSNITESVVQSNYQGEVHKGPIRHAGDGDSRMTDLRAALTDILNDIRPTIIS
ncbi:hypothetical protein IQ06DRAFT_231854, partial [Phaeosphaeriaceae sp. SRC1lsM3a]